MKDLFNIQGKVAVITGGAGMLGRKHAEAVAERGGIPVLWDIAEAKLAETAAAVKKATGGDVRTDKVDITSPAAIAAALKKLGKVDILINNAAVDAKVSATQGTNLDRFETMSLEAWHQDVAVGLTGAFLCSQQIGAAMARAGEGVILNISSDLGIIAPNQTLYRKDGVPDDQQPTKPVTYSVVKHGLIGLTRYLATYWATNGVRCNALAPAGVFNGQSDEFVRRISQLIPMGRMAHIDEYKGAVQFMVSPASSFMTGAVIAVDGGRSCW